MMTMGVSKSSLTGLESYGATFMLWGNLEQFNLSLNYSKIFLDQDYKPVMILESGVSAEGMIGVFSPNVTYRLILMVSNGI